MPLDVKTIHHEKNVLSFGPTTTTTYHQIKGTWFAIIDITSLTEIVIWCNKVIGLLACLLASVSTDLQQRQMLEIGLHF